MKAIYLSCLHCNAPLNLSTEMEQVSCPYCDATFLLEKELDGFALKRLKKTVDQIARDIKDLKTVSRFTKEELFSFFLIFLSIPLFIGVLLLFSSGSVSSSGIFSNSFVNLEKGHEMQIAQRQKREIPGFEKKLYIHLGDITRGQVMVTLLDDTGRIHPPTSLRQGQSLTFTRGKNKYLLKMKKLENYLIGTDFAYVLISRTK
ncbi:hypothetical protein ACFL35_14625 [Candidatus Riflebacteria bacterium]